MIGLLIALFVEVVPVELRVQSDALPRAEAVQLFRAVERRFRRQLGITLALDSVSTVEPLYPPDSFRFWSDTVTAFYFASTSKDRRKLVAVIAPPVALAGHRWLGGASKGVCTFPGWFSFAVASADSRSYASEIVLSHELAHLLGAEHGTGIMHPDAGAMLSTRRRRFSRASRNQIYECLGGEQ